jgi:predicted house-cleaning noncanonical NTP pyrophosphatase (MazG superfamily)
MTELVVTFNQAAFKHGISREDILFVIENFLYNEVMEGFEEKNLVLGFDAHANLLEVVYNVIDEQTINVFHAMKCRKAYFQLIGK